MSPRGWNNGKCGLDSCSSLLKPLSSFWISTYKEERQGWGDQVGRVTMARETSSACPHKRPQNVGCVPQSCGAMIRYLHRGLHRPGFRCVYVHGHICKHNNPTHCVRPPPPHPGLEPDLGAHFPCSPECLERAQSPFPMPAGALLTCPGRWGWWQLFCPPLPGRQGTPGILVVPGLSVCPAFGPTPSCLKGERACRLFLTSFISPAWCRVIVCPPLTLLSV